MSKKTLSQIVLITFIFWLVNICFAEENSDPDFAIYKNRVNDIICKEYKPEVKERFLLKLPLEYPNPYKDWKTATWIRDISSDNFIDEAKKIYKTNMNDIYKCGLLKIQIKELWNIKKLLNIDKTGEIKKSIEDKITKKITKLETIAGNWWWTWSCSSINEDKELSKKELLKNVTYETCKYVSYLDFLRKYYDKTSNIVKDDIKANMDKNSIAWTWTTQTTINKILWDYNNFQSDINSEESHAITTFPIAFQSYNEYAYNYPLHILLEIIKEDLIIFRDKLHSTINPINQLVYKISNAMSK